MEGKAVQPRSIERRIIRLFGCWGLGWVLELEERGKRVISSDSCLQGIIALVAQRKRKIGR